MTAEPTIRSRREELRLSQEVVAAAAGISVLSLHRLETGETTRPKHTTLVAVLDVLGVHRDGNRPPTVQAPPPRRFRPRPPLLTLAEALDMRESYEGTTRDDEPVPA